MAAQKKTRKSSTQPPRVKGLFKRMARWKQVATSITVFLIAAGLMTGTYYSVVAWAKVKIGIIPFANRDTEIVVADRQARDIRGELRANREQIEDLNNLKKLQGGRFTSGQRARHDKLLEEKLDLEQIIKILNETNRPVVRHPRRRN